MQYFTFFWQFLSENSGQLQTLIGVFALILAVIAALFARKQILMAQNQRLIELKLSIFNTAYECKGLFYEIRHKTKKLVDHFERMLKLRDQTLDDLVDGFNHSFRENLNFPLDLLKSSEEITDAILENLSEKDERIPLVELEKYLDALMRIKGKINNASTGYDRNIENIQNSIEKFNKNKDELFKRMHNPTK